MALGKIHLRLRLAACMIIAALPGAGVSAGAGAVNSTVRPHRIVSLNLCADQLLVALADRDQIAGLTRYATDAQMSAVASQAKGLPVFGGSAEEVIAADPDLVVGMPARRNPSITVLKGRHYPALDLKAARDYDEILGSIRDVARAVGHPERGEALIARMNADLAGLPRVPGHKVAAYYQRSGYLTGTGTLVDDLMTRVGLVNLAGKLGKPVLSQVSLEEMAMARPDFIVVDSATQTVTDKGTEMIHHPILANIPRVAIPQAWTVCGGPAYVKAARLLAAQVNKPRLNAH
ncbi:iron complex transport system substrate-binding protein [Novosphingobium sp. PhB165]|uniref:ABC transporter substrate-binding protein n=1 Tax=Novosphingobium sp. PhB165 TaxID=2485105 RepID=UPI00104FFFB6|nr:ABC transporter substrate-binding protein [Novosphingobium sp. PhB165]TCM15696.1 iron complex transport system substrate-binding protein [Novosphingobium sp. PhB165]